jgi:hypothetical protein
MLIVSPETVAVLIVVVLHRFVPFPFTWLGSRLSGQNDPIQFLSLIPVGLVGLIVHGRGDLLFPEHPAGRVLQEWPHYHMILDRYWATVLFSGGATLVTVGMWALQIPLNDPTHLAVFLGAILVSLITYLCFLNATISVRRVLSRYVVRKDGTEQPPGTLRG